VNPISGSRALTGKLREYKGNHALELVGWSNTRWTAEHQMIQRFLTLICKVSTQIRSRWHPTSIHAKGDI